MRVGDLPIPSPCAADWDDMDGDARRRFCARCQQPVTDLSALTERAAQRLLGRGEGAPCVRYSYDEQGVIEFLPEPQGQRRRWAARTGLAATLLVAAPASAERPATPLRAEQAAAPEQRPPAAPAQKKDGATPRPAQQDPPAPRKGEAERPPKRKLMGKPCPPRNRKDI